MAIADIRTESTTTDTSTAMERGIATVASTITTGTDTGIATVTSGAPHHRHQRHAHHVHRHYYRPPGVKPVLLVPLKERRKQQRGAYHVSIGVRTSTSV